MSAPIHKHCYRCGRGLPEFVEPADALGGESGACSDCRLTLGAQEVARKWHLLHPELPCAPVAEASQAVLQEKTEGTEIEPVPHEISPAQPEPVNPTEKKTNHE